MTCSCAGEGLHTGMDVENYKNVRLQIYRWVFTAKSARKARNKSPNSEQRLKMNNLLHSALAVILAGMFHRSLQRVAGGRHQTSS